MKKLNFLLLLPFLLQSAAAEERTDGWQFQLTPYLWLPTISGKLNYDLPPGNGGGAPAFDVGPTDWLDLLNGVLLLQGEARKNRFFVHTDIVYLGLESDDDRVVSISPGTGAPIPVDVSLNLQTQTNFDGFTWTLAGGYAVYQGDSLSMDVLAGARYFGVDAKTSWNLSADIELPDGGDLLARQGSVESEEKSWDAIVGIKGHMNIGEGKWSLPYYFDIGTGDSDVTWQAIAGASYAYGWGDLVISYRHFEYDGGSKGLLEKFSFSGPVIGARFSF